MKEDKMKGLKEFVITKADGKLIRNLPYGRGMYIVTIKGPVYVEPSGDIVEVYLGGYLAAKCKTLSSVKRCLTLLLK